MPVTKRKSLPTALGFSLIELVIVIILLGILAVFVGSRFGGKSGFAEYAYQARLVSVLRVMQTRAMQDTRQGYCFQINFTTSPSAFGPPLMDYTGSATKTCSTDIDFDNPSHFFASAVEMTNDQVTISALNDNGATFSYIGFDNLGRPRNDANQCTDGCRIELRAEQTIAVCIESQGYVHACQ